jgi:signal transduction histidine kinase
MWIFQPFYRWLSRSLANQLLFTYVLLITFALGIVTFWAFHTMQKEKVADLQYSMLAAAVHLSLEIDNDLRLDSDTATNRIQTATDRHASHFGYAMTVVNADGHVIADSGPRTFRTGQNIRNEHDINDALAGVATIAQPYVPQTHTHWLYVAYPVRSAGQTTGVIRVGVELTDINQHLNQDLIVFLEMILATLVFTILISLWLARRLTRPLTNMSESARQIAKSGDISVFVPVERNDEIGEMALSFNQMIGRLREEERLRQEFIANASHELKTPTMAIGSVVEALQAGAVEDPDLRYQFLHSLENLVERQSNLLKDLLDIAKLDGGAEKEYKEELNVQEIVQVAVDQVRPQAQKKQVGVEFQGETDGLTVFGNNIRLQRAIVNLLTNAVNHTPANGTVKLETKVIQPDKVEIIISDTGTGIDPADLPHIFERFYRGDKARTRTAGGTGLGLAITREIIARHHGTIDVDSVPGQGSSFTIRLPARPKPAAG